MGVPGSKQQRQTLLRRLRGPRDAAGQVVCERDAVESLRHGQTARLERSGDISFIKKEK